MRVGILTLIAVTALIAVSSCTSTPGVYDIVYMTSNPRTGGPDLAVTTVGRRKSAASTTAEARAEAERGGRDGLTGRQALVVEGATSMLGADRLVVRGVEFAMDCSGFVRAVYYYAGIDLTAEFSKYTGNGVTRIYKTLQARGLLSDTTHPSPGDVIFWDNTYDRNSDGKWNDELTHVGIVMNIDDDGSIQYAHMNYRKGIIVEHMNLVRRDVHTENVNGRTVIVNSPMRMKGQVTRPEWLSGQLHRVFGRGYLLEL